MHGRCALGSRTFSVTECAGVSSPGLKPLVPGKLCDQQATGMEPVLAILRLRLLWF